MRKILEERLRHLLNIYILELGSFMSQEKLTYLSNPENIDKIIIFSDEKTGAWCKDNNILFGNNTNDLIQRLLMSNENYGTNLKFLLVDDFNFVENEKDYLDYVEYFILTGKNELDYYLDVLPHEVMHLIGIGGGALAEGVTERRTRQICKKHNIQCAPILHCKETKLIRLMDELVGEDVLTRMGFNCTESKYDELESKIDEICGNGTFKGIYNYITLLYKNIYIEKKYDNPIDRFKAYRNMDFSKAYLSLKNNNEKNYEVEEDLPSIAKKKL